MFLAFIHAYRRVETPSSVLTWLQNSYFEAGDDSQMYIPPDPNKKSAVTPQEQMRRRSTTATKRVREREVEWRGQNVRHAGSYAFSFNLPL